VIYSPRGLEVDDHLLGRGEFLHVLGITIPVMAIEDVMATKLLALHEQQLDLTSVLRIARAVREQIDWRILRERTRNSPYAAGFFTICEELGVVPEAHVSPAADVRLLTPRR
jgi:hypothetical protein